MKGLGIMPILYIKKTLAKFAIVIIARFIFKLTKKILLNKSINYPINLNNTMKRIHSFLLLSFTISFLPFGAQAQESKEEDKTYENQVVIDDTNECESCQ